jgi:hypothetical protein
MNYAVDIGEIGSGDMRYIPSYTKTGSAIQMLIGGDAHIGTET